MIVDLFKRESKILEILKLQNTCFQDHLSLEQIECSLEDIEADDYSLLQFIRKQKLKPPKSKIVPYVLAGHSLEGQGQVEIALDYFKNKTNGVFVEAGAWDGEQYSNTLLLEKELGWTGLLVEPNPPIYNKILEKNRKSYVINSCLSTSPHPEMLELQAYGTGSRTVQNSKGTNKIECFPLYSLLLAMGQTKIDFFSLDVETVEAKVLRTIPWNKVQIELVTIEVYHSDQEEIKNIMKNAGYEIYKEIIEPEWTDKTGKVMKRVQDIMFVKK